MDNSHKTEFGVCLGALFETFGVEVTKPSLLGYWLGLEDLTIEQVKLGFANAIRSCKNLPKPVEIRELAGCWTDPDATAQLAFTRAMYAVSACGPYKTISFEDKAINAVIRSMGGWPNFCTRFTDAESEKWTRIEFIRGYKNFAWRAVSDEASRPLAGLSEVQNNQPAKPRLISCHWFNVTPAIKPPSVQPLKLVSQEVA